MHRQSGRPPEHLWAEHLLSSRRGCYEFSKACDLRHIRICVCALPDSPCKRLNPLVSEVVMIVPPPITAAAGSRRRAPQLRSSSQGRIQRLQTGRQLVHKSHPVPHHAGLKGQRDLYQAPRLQLVALGRGLHVLGVLKGFVRALHDEACIMGGQNVALGRVLQPQAVVQPPRPHFVDVQRLRRSACSVHKVFHGHIRDLCDGAAALVLVVRDEGRAQPTVGRERGGGGLIRVEVAVHRQQRKDVLLRVAPAAPLAHPQQPLHQLWDDGIGRVHHLQRLQHNRIGTRA
mmetsp:Transcript_18609/g.29658  ORF Transcript_18609/g.29658 Transcript_18609/m.29658 type:complete len:287 (+) Transcript_18609:800-1660(+)